MIIYPDIYKAIMGDNILAFTSNAIFATGTSFQKNTINVGLLDTENLRNCIKIVKESVVKHNNFLAVNDKISQDRDILTYISVDGNELNIPIVKIEISKDCSELTIDVPKNKINKFTTGFICEQSSNNDGMDNMKSVVYYVVSNAIL